MSSYDYYADAKIRHTYDSADHTFDRSQEYDHAGRLKEAYSGREVTGQLPTVPADNPYRQTYQYDVWNNQTEKSGRFWRNSQYSSTPHVNNRGGAFGYDAEGNGVILSGNNRAAYDAANKETNFINWQWTVGGSPNHPNQQPIAEITQSYDGDGQPAKRVELRRIEELILGGPNTNINETWTTTFYLRSTVLGANVVEINDNGVKTKGYVYANGERLARQEVFPSSSAVTWYHPNAGTNSWVETTSNRWVTRQEMDPVGAEVGTADPFIADPEPTYLDIKGQEPLYIDGGDPFDYSGGCTSFGMPISCSDAAHYLGSGLGQINGITTNGVNPRGPQNGGTREYVDETRIGPFWINDIRYQYADEGRFVESPYVAPQKPAPTGRPSQKLTGCVFDISVTTNGLINSKQLQAMKDEISRVFATAGQEINFVHSNANYYLSVNAVGANYTNNSEAVGLTPPSGSAVTNNGRVFVDRLTTSANIEAASSTAFNQNSNALAVGLGRAGSHEISHYLLQQNYDLRSITGVMHSGFKGSEWFAKTSEGLWKFTPAQIKQLNSLCGR